MYIWAEGARYEGEYKEDKKNGRGVQTWPSGARYIILSCSTCGRVPERFLNVWLLFSQKIRGRIRRLDADRLRVDDLGGWKKVRGLLGE